MPRQSTPQPMRALQTFIREARKYERDNDRSAGEALFGSVTQRGIKTLHRMAVLTDEFINEANKYFTFQDGPLWLKIQSLDVGAFPALMALNTW